MKRLIGYFVVAGALLLGGVWVAAQVSLHTFQPGTTIKSSEVNENFEALNEGKQNRVTGTCAEGYAIRIVNEDGTVACEADDGGAGGLSYTAGDGLNLNGVEFSVDFGQVQARVAATCATGSAIRIINEDGTVECEADDSGGTSSAIPAGAVMSFNLETCPDGWSLFTEGIGRTVVGYEPGGTLLGTVGDDLDDLESRSHAHEAFPPNASTSVEGVHNHVWARFYDYEFGIGSNVWIAGDDQEIIEWDNGMHNDGEGQFPMSLAGGAVDKTFHTSNAGEHSHSVTLFGFITEDQAGHLPYVQLLMCQKD